MSGVGSLGPISLNSQPRGQIMRRSNQIASFITCGFILSGMVATAQDWPQWRGPNRDGKARFNAPANWPKELTPKWKTAVGSGDATPALAGDKVYVFARQGSDEVARCLNAADGTEVWQNKYEAPAVTGPDSGHAGPRSSPVVSDGKVVTLGVAGALSCLDAASGKVLWRKDEFPGSWPRFHVAMSPLVHEKLCIAHLGKTGDGGVVAYDLNSGEAKWKWTEDGPSYASPVMAKAGGTDVVVVMTDKKLVALGARDGKLLWEAPFAVQGRGYNAATPIVDGQTLIYCGESRGATAVKFEKTGDALSATELWKCPDGSVQFNSPVLKDGLLYGLSGRSEFFCITAKDGKLAWTAPLTPAPAAEEGSGQRRGGMGRTAGYGSIVDGGAVLLALTPSSELVVFKPGEKAFTEVARVKVAATPTYAHLVAAGNRLIVKDQDSVALFQLP